MKFEPLKNIDHAIKEGKVTFIIKDWLEETDKSGQPIIVSVMDVTDSEGVTKTVFERFSMEETGRYVLGCFSKASGIFDKYASGEITKEDVLGKRGACDVKMDQYVAQDGATKKILRIKKYHF